MKFDISNNDIRAEGGKALAEALKDNKVMQELSIASNALSNDGRDMSGVIAISGAIPTMGALTSLNISNNKRAATKEAGKALAEMLAVNSVLKVLNVANNLDGRSSKRTKTNGPAFAQELANGVSANGAMTSLNVSNNNLTNYGRDMSGVKAFAAAIQECK